MKVLSTFISKNRFQTIFDINQLMIFYFTSHVIFLLILGDSSAFASDEGGYLYTFTQLYGEQSDPNPQFGSGWIAAPKWFLQVVYLPAELFTIFGIPEYLAIRLLSAVMATYCVWLLLQLNHKHSRNEARGKLLILYAFYIPSIFLWTSLGLRESFILLELVLVLFGLYLTFRSGISKRAFIFVFLGSLGLLCTKAYLWIILMLSILTLCLFYLGFKKANWLGISTRLIVSFGVLPVLIFTLTTSSYAWGFLLNSNIESVGARSGDSIAQVRVEVPTKVETEAPTKVETEAPTKVETEKVLTFHGDYSLILMRDYLSANPDAAFTRILRTLGAERKIQEIWDSKVESGLARGDGKVGTTEISLNSHQLQPGSIGNPISMIRPALLFLFGPVPFIGNPSFATYVASFESPLWWLLILITFIALTRKSIREVLDNPFIVFCLIFFAGLVSFSALVEVNLGTSFRHRSILLPVLVFLYLELRSTTKVGEKNDLTNNH